MPGLGLARLATAHALVLGLLVWIALFLLSAPARGADADYQPFKPDPGEAVSAPLFVVLAYSAIWLVLVGFVLVVWRQQREVQRELDRLALELGTALTAVPPELKAGGER